MYADRDCILLYGNSRLKGNLKGFGDKYIRGELVSSLTKRRSLCLLLGGVLVVGHSGTTHRERDNRTLSFVANGRLHVRLLGARCDQTQLRTRRKLRGKCRLHPL